MNKRNKLKKKAIKKSFLILIVLCISLLSIYSFIKSTKNKKIETSLNNIIKNNLKEAKNELNDLIEDSNKNHNLYIYRAYVEGELGQKEEAFKDIKSSLQLNSSNKLAYAVKTNLQLKYKDIEGAKESAEKGKDLKPKDAFENFVLGSLYGNTIDKDKAMKFYHNALSKEANYSMAYSGKGDVYFSLKEYNKALREYDRALQISRKNYKALSGKINSLIDIKKYEEAIKIGKQYLRNNDVKDIDVLYSLISAYDAKKDYNGLLNFSDELLKKDSNNYEGYLCSGWAYYNLNNYEKAVQFFNKSIVINHKEASSHNMRGWCYSSLKDYNKAKEDFEEALKLNNSYTDAYRGLAWVYNNQGKQDKSIDICNKVLKFDKDNANIYACLGWNYLEKKDNKKAKEYFNKAISINHNDIDAQNGIKLLK